MITRRSWHYSGSFWLCFAALRVIPQRLFCILMFYNSVSRYSNFIQQYFALLQLALDIPQLPAMYINTKVTPTIYDRYLLFV